MVIGGTLDVDLADGSTITNTAIVTSSVTDLNPQDDQDTVTTGVVRANDVAVDVRAEPDEVVAGGTAGYAVTVSNSGPTIAEAVVLTMQLPAELTNVFQPASVDDLVIPAAIPPGCSGSGQTVTCPLGSLTVGGAMTLQFSGQVAAGTPAGTALVGTATVTANGADCRVRQQQ